MSGFTEYASTQRLSKQLQFVVHKLSGATPIPLDIVRDSAGTLVALKGLGTTEPTGNPYTPGTLAVGETVYWEQMAKFFLVGASDEAATIYYNTGTRATPVWTATDTSVTKADILVLIGNLIHLHTGTFTGTFTGTAGVADLATIVDLNTGGTPVYVGVKQGETSPAMLHSENANAATANFETADALPVPVVFSPVSEATVTVLDDADSLTKGSQLYAFPTAGPTRWGGQPGVLKASSKALANGTVASITPTDTWEIEHFLETASRGISLDAGRLLAAAEIVNLAGIGGVPAKNSDPILEVVNGATDPRSQLHWAAASVIAMKWSVDLPYGYDETKDLRIHFSIAKGTNTNTTSEIVSAVHFDGGAAVAGTTGALDWTTETAGVITVPAANVPANAEQITLTLTPGAHANDATYLRWLRIEVPMTHGGLPVYCDRDGATTTSRLLVNNTVGGGKDIYVRSALGRTLKITHSANPAATAELVRYDNDAGGGTVAVLLYTDGGGNGVCACGAILGIAALEGLSLVALYSTIATPATFACIHPNGVATSVRTLTGNRQFDIAYQAAVGTTLAVTFDDNGATAAQRLQANYTDGNRTAGVSTAEFPFGKTPVGTIAGTIAVANSAALIT